MINYQGMQINNVTVTSQTIDQIQSDIQKSTIPSLKQVVYKDLSPIKKSACQYILKVNDIVQKMRILSSLYSKRKQIKDAMNKGIEGSSSLFVQNTDDIKAIRLTEIQLTNLIKETDLFTIALQSFLGKQTQIIYIYQSAGGKIIEAYRINNIQDIIKIQKGHAGQLQAKLKATKTMLQNSKNIQYINKERYSIGLDQAKKLDTVWSQVIRRYNKYKYKDNAHLVLWNMMSRPKWHGMWLYQRGDLAQAYANFVLKRDGTPFVGNVNNPPETDIETFMTAVQDVDSAFGGLQGDIEYYDKDGKLISAAIKSLSASPQSAIQTLKLAQQLLQAEMDEKKFLQQYAKKWERQGRNTIQNFTVQEVKYLFKNIGNSIK